MYPSPYWQSNLTTTVVPPTPTLLQQLSSTASSRMVSADHRPVGKPWELSDPIFSAHTRNILKTVFKCYIRIFIVFVGIPGNLICCAVFWKQGLKDRINLLLFWLAVADFVNLVTQLPAHITCYLSDTVVINNIHVMVNAFLNSVYLCCSFISGTLIVVMSVDRCLSVVMPLKARRLLTYRSMVVAIVLSYLIPFLGYTPWFLDQSVAWRVDPSTNRSTAYIVHSSWFPSSKFLGQIPNYLGIVGQPVYFVVVVVCNTITVIHLRHTSRKRSEMTGKMKDEENTADNRITVMLLVVCIIYAILLLSQIFTLILEVAVPEFFLFEKYHNSYIVMYQVFIFTASCTNSTVNFFAYFALSSRFRATVKDLCSFFRLKCKQ